MRHAKRNADGHERSLIQHIHAQLDEYTDAKTAGECRQLIIDFFKTLLKGELDQHTIEIGLMRVSLDDEFQLSISSSIEYFWKDELAIRGIKWPEDYALKKWVWTNDDIVSCIPVYQFYFATDEFHQQST
ncbi:hypothetical protein BDW75DRAFT_246553 [Aspergillus navahoensis]